MAAGKRRLLLALLATNCHAPRALDLGVPPDGVQTLLVVSFDPDGIIASIAPADRPALLTLEETSRLFVFGFRTPIASMGLGYEPGPIALPGLGEPGRAMPMLPAIWQADEDGLWPISFLDLPEYARELRLPVIDRAACFEGRLHHSGSTALVPGCFAEGDLERFCTPCRTIDRPKAPDSVAPPIVTPCRSGSPKERFECLVADADAARPVCVDGLAVMGGCVARAPCGFGPELPAIDVVYVLGTSPDPGNVAIAPDLASALVLAGPRGRVRLGAGRFVAGGAAIESTIEGLCPGQTELARPVFGATATVARLTISGSVVVPAGDRLAFHDVATTGSVLVTGTLAAEHTSFGDHLWIDGAARTSTATFAGPVVVGADALAELEHVWIGPDAQLSVEPRGEARVTDGRIDGHLDDRPVDIAPDGRFVGKELIIYGEIRIDTTGAYELLSLTDVAVTVRDRTKDSCIVARTPTIVGGTVEPPCVNKSEGRVVLERVLARSSDSLGDSLDGVSSAIAINCTQVDVTDLTVDSLPESAAIALLRAPGTARRLLLTNYAVFDEGDLARVPAEPPDFPGTGVAIHVPYDERSVDEVFELSDVTIYARGGGVKLTGTGDIKLDRVSVQSGLRTGMAVNDFTGRARISDLLCAGNASTRRIGAFGIEIVDNEDVMIGDVEITDFWLEANESAGLHLEGNLEAVELLRGEVRENGIGLWDANAPDFTKDPLTAVRFVDNAITLSSVAP